MFTPPYSVKGDRSLTTLIWVHIKYRYELSMLYMFRFLHVTDTYMYSIRCFRAVIFRLLVITFVKPIGTFQFFTKHITLCRWCGMQVVRRWSSLYYGSLYWYVTIYMSFWTISLSDVNVFVATFFFSCFICSCTNTSILLQFIVLEFTQFSSLQIKTTVKFSFRSNTFYIFVILNFYEKYSVVR